jgi:hypothetical protein
LTPSVGWPQQLEAFEAILIVDGVGPVGEAPSELVAGVLLHGYGVDLDHGHAPI